MNKGAAHCHRVLGSLPLEKPSLLEQVMLSRLRVTSVVVKVATTTLTVQAVLLTTRSRATRLCRCLAVELPGWPSFSGCGSDVAALERSKL